MTTEERKTEIDHALEAFKETWPAFQREGIDTRYPDTDTVRTGWAKPTLYREHEAIHVLCNVIDHLRREVAELNNTGHASACAITLGYNACTCGTFAERPAETSD